MPQDLTTLFQLGQLVLDMNGDGVPDFVNASLVVGSEPTVSGIAAAAEIAARLGFETMAMELPLARGVAGGIPIVVGRSGLAASGLESPGVDPASLDPGEGAVAVHGQGDRTWVSILGGDDAGLLAAARLFSGVLPHTRTLSSPGLARVRDDLAAALDAADLSSPKIRLTQARIHATEPGMMRVVATVAGVDVGAAAAALRDLAQRPDPVQQPDSAAAPAPSLAYPGLESVEVRLAGGAVIRFDGRAQRDPAGPIPQRPGSDAKDHLDLSNLYTIDGLLGGEPIPSRVDAILVPGGAGTGGLPDLAGRLGLESTGLIVPLVKPVTSISRPDSEPTMVLVGIENDLTEELASSGRIDLGDLAPGEGLIQLVPKAFDQKSALVVTGADEAGAVRAIEQVALTLPNLDERGTDRPTLDDVEQELWDALAGYSPVGQAAIGLYKLERIAEKLSGRDLTSARVLLSVEKAEPGLSSYLRTRAAVALGLDATELEVAVDDRDVRQADTIFDRSRDFPPETGRFWELLRDRVVPAAARGGALRVQARLSEPPELRERLAAEARQELVEAGADPERTEVVVLSAFKQGYSWLYEIVRPRLLGRHVGEITIRFRRNEPPEEWPQQAIHTPLRWLHEIFPIDEILARDLNIDLEQVRFEEVHAGPTYEVSVSDPGGEVIFSDAFEPKCVLRPYFDRFRDYEQVRVTTGWITASNAEGTLVDERIVTDPEAFWDYYQAEVLPAVYDYVMERHGGLPRGGAIDAPFFGELTVELEMSEPNHRLELDNEMHAPMDALHEEIYFGTREFFDLLGRNSRGQGLAFPGRIVPVMRPKSDGSGARVHVKLTGFATSRPAVVVEYGDALGATGKIRLDIPKTTLERPSARLAKVSSGEPGVSHLALRVRVDTEVDVREGLLAYARPDQVDETMVSAEQVVATLGEIEALRDAGLYASALALPGMGTLELWAEWTHEQDPQSRKTGTLAANGVPDPLPDWRRLVPEGWTYQGERLVQWETPIPPGEGHEILGKMAGAFAEAAVYRVGRSYLGQELWAMDLMPPVTASHWSRAKASTFKPTVIYSAREHANEVSSTSHVLRHAELLLTDPEQRAKLNGVNVIIHPFTNADGAQLAYELYRLTPDYLLHAGYFAALGQNVTAGQDDDHPIYPEAPIRRRLWQAWLPDIFLDPHGYPSHQVVQLFSEYTGLVRQGRVTERNWGFNKGWFMPSFDYVDSPDFPRHKDAAFHLRDYITRAMNSNRDVVEMNRRAYRRYERYGAAFDPGVFRLPMTDGVLIEMPLKGSSGEEEDGAGFDPRVTIWTGMTEAPDETAHGAWMELMAKAGLSWDQAVLDFLYEGQHQVDRSGSTFFGGVALRMERPRPPE